MRWAEFKNCRSAQRTNRVCCGTPLSTSQTWIFWDRNPWWKPEHGLHRAAAAAAAAQPQGSNLCSGGMDRIKWSEGEMIVCFRCFWLISTASVYAVYISMLNKLKCVRASLSASAFTGLFEAVWLPERPRWSTGPSLPGGGHWSSQVKQTSTLSRGNTGSY